MARGVERPRFEKPTVCLAIYKCHWYTPCIDIYGPEGSLGGRRMLVGKCCPNQYRDLVAWWELDRKSAEELIDEIIYALDDADKRAEGMDDGG